MEANNDRTNRILEWAVDKTRQEKNQKFDLKDSSINQINEETIIEDMRVNIEISKNEMNASIYLVPPKGGRMLKHQEVLVELADRGVIYGIDENKVKLILAKKLFNTTIQVAFGSPSVSGKNGYVNYFFKTDRELKPKIMQDGTVDYHNLGLVTNVQKGKLLAEVIPPTKGIPGKTVTGKSVPAKDGKEARLRIGKNVAVSEDGFKLFSEIDGQPILHEGKVSVLPILEINVDVGPATGDINFVGSITVKGNVKSGFVITADGDVEVYGIVEAAKIEAGGNIIIKRGVQGQGKGVLKAGQDFSARYIENAVVEAGENIIIAEAAMHSRLFAGKKIKSNGKKGLIVGGVIKAGEELVAKNIGSPMSTYTEIEVGINPKIKMDYQKIINKLEYLERDLNKTMQAIEVLGRLKRKGLLAPDKQILYEKLLYTDKTLRKQQLELINKKDKLDLMILHSNRAKVSASNVVYPGVNIIIGNASFKTRDLIKHATFYNYEGQVKFGPFEG